MNDLCFSQNGTPLSAASREQLMSDSVWKHVERILTNDLFARSERLCRFVRFSVDLTLEGRAQELNEKLLGMHVFDRGPAFDPTNDAIVRVEAHRLRFKLSQYYKKDGRNDELLIKYATGCYVPIFQERARAFGPRTRSQPNSFMKFSTCLLAPDLLLTNQRVIRSEDEVASVAARFDYWADW